MKNHRDYNRAIATIRAWWLSNVVVLTQALHYGRAARRDERNAFPYTAAMEWRNAAELFASNTLAAEYCWKQWERIMNLPRQLAGPASISRIVAFPRNPALATRVAVQPAINPISLARAA